MFEKLSAGSHRLITAILLREFSWQLRRYERQGWARRLFDNWRASLQWHRLGPSQKFAKMIGRRRDNIAASYKPENQVPLALVEDFNNRIHVVQPIA